MRLEDSYQRRVDNAIDRTQNKFDHPILKKLESNAIEVLARDSIDETSFIEHYGEDAVMRDLREVERLEKQFVPDRSQAASKVFEAIMHQHVELSNWLGPNAETVRASRYDDIKNGVDLVVEFNDEDATRHLALGVDVTFGTLSIQKKFDRILKEIEEDTLARVKYFRAHGYEGSLKQLPRVVVGVDIDKVIALAGLWDRQDNVALGNHIAKDIVADEIERQLRTFMVYAQSENKPEALRSYTQAWNTVRRMHTVRNGFLDEKSPQKHNVQNDHVHAAIMEQLKRFQSPSRQR